MRYDVVVVGFRLNASLKPAQALQRVIGLDAETSKELTRRFPANVLTGVSRSEAERVSQELTGIGAKVEVRENRTSLASEAAGSAGQPALAAPPSGAAQAAAGSAGRLAPAVAPPEAARPVTGSVGRPALTAAPPEAVRRATGGAPVPVLPAAPPEAARRATGGAPVPVLPAAPPETARPAALPETARPPALLETARPPARSEHDEGNSGNYEIGEILSPLGRAAAAPDPAPAEELDHPVTKRVSRDDLEQVLRNSFRSEPPTAVVPALSLAPIKAAPAEKPAVVDTSAAFAGMQNFGGGLDGFDETNAPQLQVDEEALRSVHRARDPTPEVEKLPAAVLQERIGSWASSALEWGTALLSLLAVAGITLLAVGYALDPDHLLRPIGLENFPEGAKKALTVLFGK